MARITANGGFRMFFNGDLGSSMACEPREHRLRFNRIGVTHRKKIRVCSVGKKMLSAGDGGDVLEEEMEEKSGFESDELSCFRGLVLDLSYRPVNVVCWRRAICLEFMEKADVLEYYDQTVASPSGSFYIPAVLQVPQVLQVVKRRRVKRNLSRKNIFFRDSFTCQYCSCRGNLTIDHVIPISRGGDWKWENLVTACARCNSKKGHRTLEEANMKLLKTPKAPKDYDILSIPLTTAAVKMLKTRKGVPDEWLQYLSKAAP